MYRELRQQQQREVISQLQTLPMLGIVRPRSVVGRSGWFHPNQSHDLRGHHTWPRLCLSSPCSKPKPRFKFLGIPGRGLSQRRHFGPTDGRIPLTPEEKQKTNGEPVPYRAKLYSNFPCDVHPSPSSRPSSSLLSSATESWTYSKLTEKVLKDTILQNGTERSRGS